MMMAVVIFALLLLGHYIADAMLQPPGMSAGKRHAEFALRWQWLSLHSASHGFFVAAVTGSALLALCEFIAHAAIDRGKGRGWYGMWADQALHVACKIAWVAVLALPR